MYRIVFRGLTTDVEVTTDDERVAALLPDLLGTYGPPAGQPAFHYSIVSTPAERFDLLLDGTPLRTADHLLDVLPLLELDLYPRLTSRCEGAWVLHAAALVRDEAAIVLAGASDAGKTTLSRALLNRGWSYLTEEATCLSSEGQVTGLARPITLAPDQRAGPLPTGARLHPYQIRQPEGVAEHHLLHPPKAQIRWSPAPLGALVRLRHKPGGTDRLRLLPASEALTSLWECSLRNAEDSLEVATALLHHHRAYELQTATIEGACQILEGLASSLPQSPAS